jgi:hypothetical protein
MYCLYSIPSKTDSLNPTLVINFLSHSLNFEISFHINNLTFQDRDMKTFASYQKLFQLTIIV